MTFFYVFFMVSGFCSLVYEIIWLRLAMATFGVNAPLVSIFLSVFMAGLGIGSLGAGLLTRRFAERKPEFFIRCYALTELLIAISALLVPYLINFAQSLLSEKFAGMSWGSLDYYGVSAILVTIIVLPWCVCMGATIPIAIAAIKFLKHGASDRSFSFLYRANVLGATIGTIAASFILIELIGLHGSLLLTAITNFIIAGSALIYSYFTFIPPIGLPGGEVSPGTSERQDSPPSYLLIMIFITGLVSMAMEIVWIRMYVRFLGTTVYAFALILGFYLLGTSLGTATYRDKTERKVFESEAIVWTIAGFLGLIPIFIINFDPYNQTLMFIISLIIIYLAIMAFSGAIGFLTPMLVDRWSRGNAYQAGRAYAVNIVGCIIGPLLAGFVLLPRVSEVTALIWLSLPLFIVGLAITFKPVIREIRKYHSGASKLIVAGITLVSLVFALFFLSYQKRQESGVVKRDYEAVVVASGKGMDKRLFVNGVSMTVMTPITKFMAHLPLALLAKPA